MTSLLAAWRRWLNRPAAEKPVLARSAFCDENGVSQYDWLGDEEVCHKLTWREIDRVVAFKRDLFAYDMIYVALVDDRDLIVALVSEESGSFGKFIADLPTWLIGCKSPDEWWDDVAFPAFETNLTELYRRPAPPPNASSNK